MQPSLKRCAHRAETLGRNSFNRITIDGDMSTNDTVILLANGLSACKPDVSAFSKALDEVTRTLARMIVSDGEGVSRFVEVEVKGAVSDKEARIAAEAIANSTLVKCAWAGRRPKLGPNSRRGRLLRSEDR
jgi:glutamate N-acetyltransferase/amino-acid N-acetyltransferase